MKVGDRIKKRREELKMTQDELAKMVGYTSRSSIAKVESNANGMLQSKLIVFANALKTTPAYLLGWEDDDDADFIASLGTINPKEEISPEIDAINTLLYAHGKQFIKVKGEYFFDEAGQLTENEIQNFLNTITTMVNSAADVLIQQKTKQIKSSLRNSPALADYGQIAAEGGEGSREPNVEEFDIL